jgi:cytochrome c oxidase subunit 1
MTFFVQHFLGLLGMPRRVFTFLPNQGFETMNLISTIGAILMGVGTLILAINMLLSFRQPKGLLPNDPWGDGRSLEWAIPSPPPEYNFKQIPLVRGSDPWWKEKMEGNKEMQPAEPLGPIHMPSPSFLPFLMSVGFFIAGFGFIYHLNWLTIAGLVFVLLCMAARSLKDDHGYHIYPEGVKE